MVGSWTVVAIGPGGLSNVEVLPRAVFVEADTGAAVLVVETYTVVEGDAEELYCVSVITVEGERTFERTGVLGEAEEGFVTFVGV